MVPLRSLPFSEKKRVEWGEMVRGQDWEERRKGAGSRL